jgi:hypothetical protein
MAWENFWRVNIMTKRIVAVMALLILASFGAAGVWAQEQAQAQPQNPQQDSQGQYEQQPPDMQQGSDQGTEQGAPDQQGQSAQAPSDQGVARVSMIQGDVSTQRGDSGDWQGAALNVPLVNGDKVSTGDNSRAEVQLDYANIVRLDSHAEVGVATLDRKHVQIQVGQGLVNYSVLRGAEADTEIDTPNVAIHPTMPGRYRVQVNSDNETQVIVREGEADITTPQGSKRLQKGQLMTIRGGGNDVAYKVTNAPGKDSWDSFNQDRDRIIVSAASWQHTDPYYTGTQDLDSYGTWTNAPGYGYVWQPTVAAGWSPYYAGRWAWEPYYGWTWVSSEPWGWAPYHYGRWFLNGSYWAWWPGPVYRGYYPLWAPAYVSFFGWGGGWGFGFGFGWGWGGWGRWGWGPLGPGDWFHPWWGGWRGRFGAVNINHITVNNFHNGIAPLRPGGFSTVHGLATNARLQQSIAHVPGNSFGRGTTPTRGITADQARGAQAVTGNLPVTPSRAGLRTSDRPASRSSIPSRTTGQHFQSIHTPAAAPRSFSQESAQVKQSIDHAGQTASETTRNNGINASKQGATSGNRTSASSGAGATANRNTESSATQSHTQTAPTRAQSSVQNRTPASGNTPSSTAPQGWTQFANGHTTSTQPSQSGMRTNTNAFNNSRSNAPSNTSRPLSQSQSREGWQRFAQEKHPNNGSSYGRSSAAYNSQSRYGNQSGSRYGSYGSSGYSRPPLDMSKPIVNSHGNSYGGSSRPSYGSPYGGGQPSYGGSYGGSSHPSYGGIHGAPSGGSSHGGGGHSGGGGGHGR